jgi:hypothetical protein
MELKNPKNDILGLDLTSMVDPNLGSLGCEPLSEIVYFRPAGSSFRENWWCSVLKDLMGYDPEEHIIKQSPRMSRIYFLGNEQYEHEERRVRSCNVASRQGFEFLLVIFDDAKTHVFSDDSMGERCYSVTTAEEADYWVWGIGWRDHYGF